MSAAGTDRPTPGRGLARELTMGVLGALTVWATMLSWRPLAEEPGTYLTPLLIIGVAVAALGAILRCLRVPVAVALVLQLVAAALAATTLLLGRPDVSAAGRAELQAIFTTAWTTVESYAAPIPADAAGIHPLLIALGLVFLLVFDALAVGWRRLPAAGLVLLAIYVVPVSVTRQAVPWWVFVAGTGGYLALLYGQERASHTRWGRALSINTVNTAHQPGRPTQTATARPAVNAPLWALAIGTGATSLALLAPSVVPTYSLSLFAGGLGGGGAGSVTIRNPMTDLRRDLERGEDVDLIDVRTTDPDPRYLRISVLTTFDGREWRAGEREIPADQRAVGPMPPGPGLTGDEPGDTHAYYVHMTQDFVSQWLPTYPELRDITTVGDWRYDRRTMDIFTPDPDLETAGANYRMSSRKIHYRARALARSGGAHSLDDVFTDLPADLPPEVERLARAVTDAQPTRFEKAQALQRWFQEDGGFTYSLEQAPAGNGSNALSQFLDEETGRVGYCEQFASAMAVMARTIDIPARVAVGFLTPDRIDRDRWLFSSHDLHAWPELYFPGEGWVRFEPTPTSRTGELPAYTTAPVPDVNDPQTPETPEDETPAATPDQPTDDQNQPQDDPDAEAAAGSGITRAMALAAALAVAVLAALLTLPRWVRRARRRRRMRAGDAHAAWAELRDTATDLGEDWPHGRSPRATGEWVGALLGPEQTAAAAAALTRVVRATERAHYARPGGPPEADLRADVEAIVAALRAGATRSALRRADWWPRSVLRRYPSTATATGTVEAVEHGRLVDHVG